jgi:ATP-binding cassette, subfamily B, bacterial
MKKFPFYKQMDRIDCGPTCLKMIAKYYGKTITIEYLREKAFLTKQGVTLSGIAEAAETIGMHTFSAKVNLNSLKVEVPLPCIAHWRQRHYVIVYGIKGDVIYVADPDFGLLEYSTVDFLKGWINENPTIESKGVVLLIEPTPEFYQKENQQENATGIKFLFPYFKKYGKYINQLIIGLLTTSLIQLILPFLTQSIVDYGIRVKSLDFINLVLIAQLMLFLSLSSAEIIRGWLLLHMGSRINISIISDFLTKLMRLPMSFFDSRQTGDIIQRVEDNKRVEAFLSSTSLSMIFSVFNFMVFGVVLALYSGLIFSVFLVASLLYVGWILFFLKKRAVLDYKRFDESSGNTSSLVQLLHGIQEIKLNNSERKRRWEWEAIQLRLFKISVQGLRLNQYQISGGVFINELKNIIITFIAAKSVIDGTMTLGMMLSVQYILGQLNGPINNIAMFSRSWQDAKISLNRLAEIHTKKSEEVDEEIKLAMLPKEKSVLWSGVSFRYGGRDSQLVLDNINCHLPEGKVTAIVGASGSGKTTLLKLLLKFYSVTSGTIAIGQKNIELIDSRVWRSKCGVVMQDGFIFSDTVARNITESNDDESVNTEMLLQAVKIANIEDFIESLPLGYNTRIGASGLQLSGGQKQRILIARAVYKNPDFLFFDEATSALDSSNELIIMRNLENFYKQRTVLVIAHRLSTVKNADKILVLDKGHIVEEGTHVELVNAQGPYFKLVKNQLELGN